MKVREFGAMLVDTFVTWRQDKTEWYAAALAYYTVFSLAPLLIIVIAIAGIAFGEEAAQGEIVGQIKGLVGTEGAMVIETAIRNARQAPGADIATLLGLLVLLWGASRVFAQLQEALNTIWGVKSKPPKGEPGFWKSVEAGALDFIRKRLLSSVMVLGTGFLLLVSLLISAALSAVTKYMSHFFPARELVWFGINNGTSFVIFALLFAMIYKDLPDVIIGWGEVRAGAILTALLFSLGKFGLGYFLGRGSFASVYGAAGSLVILLLWVFFSSLILFFGAEFTKVHARRTGARIRPGKFAVPISKEERRNLGRTVEEGEGSERKD